MIHASDSDCCTLEFSALHIHSYPVADISIVWFSVSIEFFLLYIVVVIERDASHSCSCSSGTVNADSTVSTDFVSKLD